jgi:hypothetical protein
MSLGDPAAKGRMRRIGLLGYDCAKTLPHKSIDTKDTKDTKEEEMLLEILIGGSSFSWL